MYKLFLSLFIIWTCYSCNTRQTRKLKNAQLPGVELQKVKVGPDSTMISLRSFKVISLIDLLCRDWNMDDADQKHWSSIFWDSVADKRKYPGFSLFHDFNATVNPRSEIKFGKWAIDKPNRILQLKMKGGTQRAYYIQELSLSSMKLTWEEGGDQAWLKLSADSLVHKDDMDDPFHFDNNLWRLKPSKPESPNQITQRVRNCVHFYSTFFKDNYQRHLTDISFIGLPTCFEWYNGGIGLPPAIDLDKKWRQCFYSDDQAYKGYDLLKEMMERHLLEWPDKHLIWTQRIQIVLDQMHDRL